MLRQQQTSISIAIPSTSENNANLVGTRFKRGIVLYLGTEPHAFGPDLFALPAPVVWGGEEAAS